MTQKELLEELRLAVLVQIIVIASDGESLRVELRGNGIKRLAKMVETCRCDE